MVSLTLFYQVPNSDLHSTSANNNIGLVEYALILFHGQSINSVLDGVFSMTPPALLSIPSSNMYDKLTSPCRLPRRYSDCHRDISTPVVGSSGSTPPSHFAAANGHTNVIRTLLLHGAHADKLGYAYWGKWEGRDVKVITLT